MYTAKHNQRVLMYGLAHAILILVDNLSLVLCLPLRPGSLYIYTVPLKSIQTPSLFPRFVSLQPYFKID
jgi:hypothetical protein